MSECKLVFMDFQQKSKARPVFRIFKPSECIFGEPFEIHLTLKNDSDHKFEGGKCKFDIKGNLNYDFWVALPSFEPGEIKTVVHPNIKIGDQGFLALKNIRIFSKEDGKTIICKDRFNKLTSERGYPLFFSTREEIYQKYSVVVALFFSTLATILTIINVLIAIFG